MPVTYTNRYHQNGIQPFVFPDAAKLMARRTQASLAILAGTILGAVTAGVNAVQTLTVTGTPTGGGITLGFAGFTTSLIAFNASAAAVQAALEALPSIGTGNVTCSGGALPGTPVVITFTGSLAASPVELITVVSSTLSGGSSPAATVANTTTGVRAGGLKAWDGSLVSPPGVPTVSAVSGGTGFGDGTNPIGYAVQVTFYNANGETVASQAAPVTVTSSNRTIRVGAYNSVAAGIAGARYYVNGALAGQTAVSSGNIAQTDLTAFSASGGVAPDVNTCYVATDGSHIPVGIASVDIYTDANGAITMGQVNTGMEHGQTYGDVPIFVEGYFRIGDLRGITAANGPQLARFGRFITGAWNDAEAIYRFGAL